MPMYGTDLREKRGVSHTFIMVDPKFLGEDSINSIASNIQNSLENVSAKQYSLMPGIKETLTKKIREREGIPVSNAILKGWFKLGFKND